MDPVVNCIISLRTQAGVSRCIYACEDHPLTAGHRFGLWGRVVCKHTMTARTLFCENSRRRKCRLCRHCADMSAGTFLLWGNVIHEYTWLVGRCLGRRFGCVGNSVARTGHRVCEDVLLVKTRWVKCCLYELTKRRSTNFNAGSSMWSASEVTPICFGVFAEVKKSRNKTTTKIYSFHKVVCKDFRPAAPFQGLSFEKVSVNFYVTESLAEA